MAGALAEMSRQSLARDFRHFDPGSARIVLLEGGPSLLDDLPRAAARRRANAISSGWASRCGPGRPSRECQPGRVAVGGDIDRGGDDPVGGGRGGLAARARRSASPLDRAGRVPCSRTSRSPGIPTSSSSATWRRSRARTAGRCPASRRWRSRWGGTRRATSAARSRAAAAAVPLPQSRQHGDDRPRVRDRRLRLAAAEGLDRLARLAVRPHPEPDRLPQPPRRARAVGVGVLQLSARDPADHRRRHPARMPRG